MKDYQVLIDHAWSLNPDLFEMFREHFQIHLNKRRSIVEFQDKLTEAEKRRYVASVGGYRHQLGNHIISLNPPQCNMPARDILPRKISWDKLPLHPSKTWVTPIESIHPPQYFIAGLPFEPEPYSGFDDSEDEFDPSSGQPSLVYHFHMVEIRQVCEEFGWEMLDAANEVMNSRPYVRALMELEG